MITKDRATFRKIIEKHLSNGTDAMTLARTAKVCYGLNIGTQEFSSELQNMVAEGDLIETGRNRDGWITYGLSSRGKVRRMSNEQIIKELGF